MTRMLPDPTFYPSPAMASQAPAESLAYVALLTPESNGKKDALGDRRLTRARPAPP